MQQRCDIVNTTLRYSNVGQRSQYVHEPLIKSVVRNSSIVEDSLVSHQKIATQT